jgi:hypothetical protein
MGTFSGSGARCAQAFFVSQVDHLTRFMLTTMSILSSNNTIACVYFTTLLLTHITLTYETNHFR